MTSFSREQSVYVSRIPLEIFSEILSYFESSPEHHKAIGDLIPDTNSLTNRTIKSMSLVCRHFYFHLFPFRLETMFIVNDGRNQSKYKLSHCHRFCKAIVDGNGRARTLARYVKRCAIGCFNLNGSEIAVEKQLATCAKALLFMTSVHELHIFRTSITNEILNSILSLPPLKALRLDDCNVPEVLDKKLLRQFSTLRATHIYVRGIFFNSKQPATDQFLSSMCISHTKSLTCNGTTCFHLLKALASLGPLEHLSHLHIGVLYLAEYKELLSDALSSMPTLRHLHIGKVLHWQPDTIPFDPFMYTEFPELPRLEYIHAPIAVLHALVPGSRVSTIGIAPEKLTFEPVVYAPNAEVWETLASAIQRSQHPVFELDVPLNFYSTINVEVHFPRLHRLKIRLLHTIHFIWPEEPFFVGFMTNRLAEIFVKNFVNTWVVHPELTYLEFVTEPLLLAKWELSDESLALLASKIPSLQTVVFSCPKNHCDGRESERREYLLSELGLLSP